MIEDDFLNGGEMERMDHIQALIAKINGASYHSTIRIEPLLKSISNSNENALCNEFNKYKYYAHVKHNSLHNVLLSLLIVNFYVFYLS